jgi:hypothetical protein
MKCAGCRRDLEVGDHYIEATASEFMGRADDGLNGLMADILGSGNGDKLVYCEDCTQDGGQWRMETFYGDESASASATKQKQGGA